MKKLKKSIIVKQVKDFKINKSIKKTHQPIAGDVAIFKVDNIGKHSSIQGVNGNNYYIFPGDYIMAAFGNRYATGQFEGYVSEGYQQRYQILGKGGAIGTLASMHAKLEKVGATTLKLVGYAVDGNNKVINTKYLTESPEVFNPYRSRNYEVILSVGASMDSGKTTSAAYLCRGLNTGRAKVAYIKLTGTVYSKDRSFVRDCGADLAIDFSYLGFPSTYMCDIEELLNLYETLLKKVEAIKPTYLVIEIADGLLQRETFMLLNNKAFMNTVDHIMLSCGDSLSVMSGLNFLKSIDFPPFAVSGLLTASPLLTQEVRDFCEVPVLTLKDLSNSKTIRQLLEQAKQKAQQETQQEMNQEVKGELRLAA